MATSAKAEGVEEVWAAVQEHRDQAEASGALAAKRRARLLREAESLAAERFRVRAAEALEQDPALGDDLAERRIDPYAAAQELLRRARRELTTTAYPRSGESRATPRLRGASVRTDPCPVSRSRRSSVPTTSTGGIPTRSSANPGVYPFTRGAYPSMYRGRLWTMRQFAGYGTPAETNARYRFLTDHGQTGLSVAFDMPTLMGLDSDDPRSEGEVGRCGVATDSLDDFETLFDQIPLGDITTSMTISGPAVVAFAFFLATAERARRRPRDLDGTLQTDIFKEYIAQKEWVFPPRPHLRLIGDLMAFCAERVPKWHPISVSGYHIREAGATAAEELAFTLADGFAYVELGMQRGLDVDAFAPALSFFFNAHIDFFEEIAKLRAARRIWARWLRDRYGATSPESMRLRFHTQTAGVSLTAQQPMNNVVRTAIEALAAVLGGTQSLHTNALDEVLALPTEDTAKLALRTQQVIAFESGVADVIDPLGGSWFVEEATDRIEALAEEIFAEIERMGDGLDARGRPRGDRAGVVPAADRRVGVPGAAALRVGRPREGGRDATSWTRTRTRSTRS